MKILAGVSHFFLILMFSLNSKWISCPSVFKLCMLLLAYYLELLDICINKQMYWTSLSNQVATECVHLKKKKNPARERENSISNLPKYPSVLFPPHTQHHLALLNCDKTWYVRKMDFIFQTCKLNRLRSRCWSHCIQNYPVKRYFSNQLSVTTIKLNCCQSMAALQ